MRTSIVAALLMTTVASAVPAGQAVNLRPGKYEITAEMSSPQGARMPGRKGTQCITADQLKDPSKAFRDPEMEKECKVSDFKAAGNTITFRTECSEGGMRATGTTEVTIGTDSYVAVVSSKDNTGRTMTIRQTAKWIGECGK